ncbi:MAG TPA: SufS family cysteine desulfurase [bacterium]|nr:SufS family cysteine desulfurase [bacterium]HQI47143.1 SufS family cysteine desulfurase [bacterium]HQJ63139.1 SufS family cysteine desulfurase [bacterium]
MLDVRKIRSDFPLLVRPENRDLVYIDSAATTHRPRQVLEAMEDFYRRDNANPHRGAYRLAERATAAYEAARARVAAFIGAGRSEEIIFTRNATEAVNLVAWGWAERAVQEGDEIIVTELEHHSNLVPWQMVAQRCGARLRFLEIDEAGRLSSDQLDDLLTPRTRLLAITQTSNALGTIVPLGRFIDKAHAAGALVLVDGAQSVPHMAVDVQALDTDFLAFSGHKMLGPLGIGVLYGKMAHLEKMNPFLFGGDMISSVDYMHSEWNDVPWKFEAGTQNVAGAVGLAAAIDYLEEIGMTAIAEHDHALTQLALEKLASLEGIILYGPRTERGPALSFNLASIHPHDLATFLDQQQIAIRSGHHCAQVVMHKLQVPATARASFYLYNSEQDVERLVNGLLQAKDYFEKWL